MPDFIIPFIPLIIIVVVIVLIFMMGYVKASPDTAFIISGLRKTPKVLIGKAGIKVPFLEKKDELSLQLIPIDVKTSSAVPTADYINIRVDAAVNVKVSDNPERLRLAAQNFLNKKTEYVANVSREVLEGNMREIVGKMNLEEMVSDRQKFANLVKENAEPDLAAMGLDIVSFNVQNFEDGNGVIDNLGVDNIVKIQKNAAISRAESERDIRMAQARAEKEANDAKVESETRIAQMNNELEIKKAELKRKADTAKAEADAAYEIQKQEQRKTIETATVNASIAKAEREAELKEREVAVVEQTLAAEVRKKAESDRYAVEQAASADLARERAKAEAAKYMMEQESEGVRAKGQAEAEAIRAKALAEAEGMEKKAEAYAKYNNAAVAEMIIKALPEIAASIAKPLSQIDKISIIGGSGTDSNGVNSVADNVPAVMAKLFETMKATTGVDLAEIIRADSYDAKVNKKIEIKGLENTDINGEVAGHIISDTVQPSDEV